MTNSTEKTPYTYQQIKVCFVGGEIRDYYGKLTIQAAITLMHIFDNDICIATINSNHILWMEWVK